MKVLLFTHMNDIDGLGNGVLAKLAFDDLTYELCRTFEINAKVLKYLNSGDIYNYDQIYVTDICIKEPLLNQINNDERLKNKILIFDHHKSEIEEKNNQYSWVNIIVEDSNGKCCGTSLFYDYLVDNKYILDNKINNRFKELTRRYDTWEWKTKYNDEESRELTLLMDLVGEESYINLMYNKLTKMDIFKFDEYEKTLIENEKKKIINYINESINNMIIKTISGNKVGVIFSELYRNDIAEGVRNRNIDVDYIAIINGNKKQVSLRNIKPDFDVSEIAIRNGGKGHKEAAASLIQKNDFDMIIKQLIK
jgi:uncharacterized protein